MTPPEPSRMRSVCAATWAINTAGAEDAIVGMLWCSAYQTRVYPNRSACRARVTESAKLSPTDWFSRTVAKSMTDRGSAMNETLSRENLL